MDLTVSGKYLDLRNEVKSFLALHGHLAPPPFGGRKKPDQRMLAWHRLLVERGYALRGIPREYGGYGSEDPLEAAVIADVFGEFGISQGIANQGISMLVPTLLQAGTEEQRRKYIRPTILGEMIWCQGYSEPEAGSDLASLKTRATVDGDSFVINGQKIWTSAASYAHMMFMLCRTEPDLPKHQGISYLLVSMDTPGLEVRPLVTMTERREFNEVFFTDVRVPVDQIVGARGHGWSISSITLEHERAMLGDSSKIALRLKRIANLMREHSLDGVPIMQIAAYRNRLLQLQGEALAWRAHAMRLRTLHMKGKDAPLHRLIVKYGSAMLAWRLSALALDTYGAIGLEYEPAEDLPSHTDATEWHVDYMNDIAVIIGGGSANIQKNVIAERGLGLPREPKTRPAES